MLPWPHCDIRCCVIGMFPTNAEIHTCSLNLEKKSGKLSGWNHSLNLIFYILEIKMVLPDLFHLCHCAENIINLWLLHCF